MIHLKANAAAGRTKREYIEAVIDDCKQIFNTVCGDKFFRDDNLKVAFCTSENQADVYSMFCEQFFPLWLTESYSRSNYFAAQAMANMPEGIYGILFCLDTYDEGDVWYQIVLHEMSHIFCIANEFGGENFQEKYFKEKAEDARHHFAAAGYAVWREFIANYMAMPITPLVKPPSLVKLREIVRDLDEGITRSNPDCSRDCSQILSFIFAYPKIRSAQDVDEVFRILDKNRIFVTRERSRDYRPLIRAIFAHLKQKEYWSITFEFMEQIGTAYCMLVNW